MKTAVDIKNGFDQALLSFQKANADCKLTVLSNIYQKLEQAIATPAPAILFSQIVNNLIRHIQHVNREDQMDVLRDMLNGAETRFGGAYLMLNVNMRMAFWYRLLQGFQEVPVQSALNCHGQHETVQTILHSLEEMDLNQQMHFLRCALDA